MSLMGLFLQSAPLTGDDAIALGILGLIMGFFFIFIMFLLGLYIYSSFAHYSIAKKAKLKSPGLAWIPFVGPTIIVYQASKMHWWPWLLLIGVMIPFVGFIPGLIFAVFTIIWHWKTFEVIGKPGWWAILLLIPVVGLVMLGIAAWSKK